MKVAGGTARLILPMTGWYSLSAQTRPRPSEWTCWLHCGGEPNQARLTSQRRSSERWIPSIHASLKRGDQ